MNTKAFSLTLFLGSASMIGVALSHRDFYLAGLLVAAFGISVYSILESYGWFDPKPSLPVPVADPEFQAGPPKSAEDFLALAKEQVKNVDIETPPPANEAGAESETSETVVRFVEMPQLDKSQSELRFFDDVSKSFKSSGRTLVISHFHRRQIASKTLADHLLYNENLADILCNEISPNIDLIPYAGAVGLELGYLASRFIDIQKARYSQIVFLLPQENLRVWMRMLQPEKAAAGVDLHATDFQ